ncbi:m147R [Myxoma virus]|nr:m147R [Myxoma virus]AFU77245.1 m147R [Myxoma virus]AFU77410.1 m147R [Myxoma virus]AFU77578.1 m147R [Myxoma virus]AFU77914.1 m147R [Myxoma virus]
MSSYYSIKRVSPHLIDRYAFTLIKESDQCFIHKGAFNNTLVVVRTFKKFHKGCKAILELTENEIRGVKRVDRFNLLKVYGFFVDVVDALPRVSIILEYCTKGYLREVLYKEQDLPFKTRLDMALDCCTGLASVCKYTKKPYEHLSSVNFLVDGDYTTKILCHGLEKTLSVPPFKNVNMLVYRPRRILLDIFSKYTEKDDMYGLGVVLWEIFTGHVPFNNATTADIYDAVVNKNDELKIDTKCPRYIKNVVDRCTSHQEDTRPTLNEVLHKISMYRCVMQADELLETDV